VISSVFEFEWKVESVVDSSVEVFISTSDDDVEVPMEVTSFVDISVDVEDSVEVEILSKTVGKILECSDIMEWLLVNVDVLCRVVEISADVDENSSSTTSEVLVITLLALLNVDVII